MSVMAAIVSGRGQMRRPIERGTRKGTIRKREERRGEGKGRMPAQISVLYRSGARRFLSFFFFSGEKNTEE